MKTALSRRGFLATAAAASVPLFLPSRVLGRPGVVSPNNRIRLGVIGLGDRGRSHIGGLVESTDCELAAVCDTFLSKAEGQKQRIEKAYAARAGTESFKGCLATQDFREILDRDDIDAVIITSPENWHAVMAIRAMEAGKDVYCEKALSLTVAEGRAVVEAVKRTGRVFQAGTQQRSDRNFRHACELARNGLLGDVKNVWVGVPGGPQPGLMKAAAVPADLNYDLWLGPASFRPYREGLCTYNWYFVTEYCAGWIQSWGVHHMDIALWGMPELHASTLEVEGTAGFAPEGDADVSFTWEVKMAAPSGLTLNFASDGRAKHGHGVRFEGDKGWVHVVRGGIDASDKSLLTASFKPGADRLPISKDHQLNFLQCMRTRAEPVAPARVCHLATTATLVADIATRAGRKLKWDWKTELFPGDELANRRLNRAMRAPWSL